jgi:anti-sigma factor RsiW
MPDRNLPVTEDELHAYVDGELPEDRRAAVETWLATHPDEATRVNAWRSQADAIRSRFSDIAGEPIPARLTLEKITSMWRPSIAVAAAAILFAIVLGGAAGWWARGAAAVGVQDRYVTADALRAHQLYVVEVRHPVEVVAAEREHLVRWLSKRLDYEVLAPELENIGLKLVGGRLLPGRKAAAAFIMYEGPSGERFTLYSSRARTPDTAMRYSSEGQLAAFSWVDGDVAYVVSGESNRDQLQKVAQAMYAQMENRPPAPSRPS